MVDERTKSDNLRFKHINKYVKGKEVLDIGAKEGYIHSLIEKSNPDKKIYSLDLEGSDFNANLNDGFSLNKKFDTIIAGEILEHVDNPPRLIRDCVKHLKKGGRLILTTPNATGLQYLRNPSWCVTGKFGHIAAFTFPMLEHLFTDSGLKVFDKKYINAFWVHNPLQIVGYLIKRLRTDLLIVGDL